MSKLDKSKALASMLGKSKPFAVEVDGSQLFIKKLSVGEQGALAEQKEKGTTAVDLSLHLLCYSLCDEAGKRLFDEGDFEDLEKMDSDVFALLIDAINRLNGFDRSVQDIKKN